MNFSTIYVIYKKEMGSYFYSPIAYVFIVLFILVLGWFFTATLFINGGEATMRPVFDYIPIFFLIFVPAVTMKSISEEKRSRTFELLITMPVRDGEIILGKFFAALVLVSVAFLLTIVYIFTLATLGNIDGGEVFGGYIGLILLSGTYVALGVLASSLTENQIVALIIAFVLTFFFFIIDRILIFLPVSLGALLEYLSINYHFANIARGVLDTRDLIYYLSIIFISLFIATKILETRKKLN